MGQAGQMAFTIGGAAIGSFFGGPIGGAIGSTAGGLIGSFIFNRAAKPLIPDMQFAASTYGKSIPIVYGQSRVPAMIIWQSDIQTKLHGVGKGFGAGSSTTSFWQSAALALCEGPARVLKIWTDGKLFFDATSANPTELTKYTFAIRMYVGDENQFPDPLLAQWVFANVAPAFAAPAYRGICYLVFQQPDLAHYGNRFPNVTCLVSTDVAEAVSYTQIVYPVGSASSDFSVTQACVDWARGLVYVLSADSTLRSYSVATGQMVVEMLWGAQSSGSPAPGVTPVCMVCVQGGGLYLSSNKVYYTNPDIADGSPGGGGSAAGYSDQLIWSVDPNSLRIHTITDVDGTGVPVDTVSTPDSGRPFDLNNNFTNLIALTVSGQAISTTTIVVGCWIFGGAAAASLATGNNVELTLTFDGLSSSTVLLVGNQDTTNGSTDLYTFNRDFLADPTHVYITRWTFSISPTQSELTSIAGVLGFADFGLSSSETYMLSASDFGVAEPSGYYEMGVIVFYDSGDNTLIISEGFLGATIKFSLEAGVIWTQPYAVPVAGQPNYVDTYTGVIGGAAANAFFVLDTNSGALTTIPQDPLNYYSVGCYSYSSAVNGTLSLGLDGKLHIAYLQRLSGNEVSVANIISDLCLRSGLTAEQFDVTAVTATTIGYTVTESKSAIACIQDLLHTYQLNMVESDYKLKFVPRGGASVVTIPQSDLASIDAQDPSKYFQSKRAIEQELPLQLNVRYIDPAFDYQANAAYGKRIALPVPTQFSRRIKSVDLPIIATNLEARQIAENWLYTLWAERDTYETMLSPKYLYLDATDTITVVMDNGDDYVLRIESDDVGADYSKHLSLASEDLTVYQPSQSPGATLGFTPQVLIPAPFLEFLLFNVPLLQDSDDLGGVATRIYYAGGATTLMNSAPTATVYKSTDNTNFPQFASMSGFANWGRATTRLADTVAPFCTDYTNTLTVTLATGSVMPSSCQYLDLMNGVNPFLVGQEIIQAQTVTSNANGTVTLSTLLRGRRGTDWATSTHQTGETVIALSPIEISSGQLTLGEIGQSEFWRLVPSGRTLDAVSSNTFAYLGYDMFPYAPVQLARAASGSDLVISWTRRTRIGGLLVDGTDTAPLNEESEAYEVYILPSAAARAAFDPTKPATYTRAFTGLTAPTVIYDAAMMTTDGFVPATATLYCCVYQISAVVGRGFQAYAALPAF